jgi:hypothetical protein
MLLLAQHGNLTVRDFRQQFGIQRSKTGVLISNGHCRDLLFPSIDDACWFFLALLSTMRVPPEALRQATKDCLTNKRPGFVDFTYIKRRASRGRDNQGKLICEQNMRDGGLTTPGAIIRVWLRISAGLRNLYPDHPGSHLLWFCTNSQKRAAATNVSAERVKSLLNNHANYFGTRFENLDFRSFRKSQKAIRYIVDRGNLARISDDHSKATFYKHYASIPALEPIHKYTVEQGLKRAADDTITIISNPDLTKTRDALSHAVGQRKSAELYNEENDSWLARCGDFEHGPFSKAGAACENAIVGCLHCPNAYITPTHLPAILAYLTYITEQSNVIPENTWKATFHKDFVRISRDILPYFSDAQVEAAKSQSVDFRPIVEVALGIGNRR